MNTILKNGCLALLFVLATTLSLSAQIKPSKKKTTPPPTEETTKPTDDTPSPTESGETGSKPSTSPRKKTTAKKTDQYFDEAGGFKHRLQYGAHMNPAIASLFGGQFNIRVDPIFGYKFNNWSMAGLTSSIDYTNIRVSFQGPQAVETYKYNAVNLAFGVYGRLKFLQSFYVHTDYKLARYTAPNLLDPYDVVSKKINILKVTKPELNIGGVYRSAMGALGYEFVVTFNALYNDSYITYKDSPLDIKVGLTYNF